VSTDTTTGAPAPGTASSAGNANGADGTVGAQAAAETPPWAELVGSFPLRVLGALLLVGALDPARWPTYLCPQWFAGFAALVAGFWAGGPVVERPVVASFRLGPQIVRHRNTLLVAASALLAAFQGPPTWLMVVEVLLLPTYLVLVDAGAAPARPANRQIGEAACAYAASVLVLLAALAPVTGGWWGRIVAAAAVLGALSLVFGVLRLRRPAGYPHRPAAATTTAAATAATSATFTGMTAADRNRESQRRH
jgi:hypothetical protein